MAGGESGVASVCKGLLSFDSVVDLDSRQGQGLGTNGPETGKAGNEGSSWGPVGGGIGDVCGGVCGVGGFLKLIFEKVPLFHFKFLSKFDWVEECGG